MERGEGIFLVAEATVKRGMGQEERGTENAAILGLHHPKSYSVLDHFKTHS